MLVRSFLFRAPYVPRSFLRRTKKKPVSPTIDPLTKQKTSKKKIIKTDSCASSRSNQSERTMLNNEHYIIIDSPAVSTTVAMSTYDESGMSREEFISINESMLDEEMMVVPSNGGGILLSRSSSSVSNIVEEMIKNRKIGVEFKDGEKDIAKGQGDSKATNEVHGEEKQRDSDEKQQRDSDENPQEVSDDTSSNKPSRVTYNLKIDLKLSGDAFHEEKLSANESSMADLLSHSEENSKIKNALHSNEMTVVVSGEGVNPNKETTKISGTPEESHSNEERSLKRDASDQQEEASNIGLQVVDENGEENNIVWHNPGIL